MERPDGATCPNCFFWTKDLADPPCNTCQELSHWEAMNIPTKAELIAFRSWKDERDERNRKRGPYWLTPEGRKEAKECFKHDDDNCVRPYLDELERMEHGFEHAIHERDCYKEVLIGAEFENISELPNKGIEFCHAVGSHAKERIKRIKEENMVLGALKEFMRKYDDN